MKRITILFCICIVSQVAVAQCKFTMSLSINGCSNSLDGRIAEKTAESLFNHYVEQMGIGFNSLQECNTARNIVISELNMTDGNCRIRVNVSPCSGCSGRTNSADILAIGQGSGFYSTNSANEIRDWSNDDMERMLALNPNYKSNESSTINTDDSYYDNARINYGLSGRMPDGSTKYIKNADLLRVVGANKTPGSFTLSSDMMPITMTQPESGVYVPPIHDAYAEMLKIEEEKRQRELEWEQTEAKIWDEIKNKLDDENFHLLAFILQYNNGGERPKFLGMTESGRYIFESNDGNNVFSVSKDANDIQTLTFEEHSWSDDNIIKAIQEKGFKDVIDDRFDFEIKGGKLDFLEVKDGKISFKDIENLSPDKLRKLLPYIKGEIKLKLFDNSSELSYEYMHLFDSHVSGGGKVTLSSGGKDNISASLTLSVEGEKSEMGSNGNAYFSGSTSTQKDGLSFGPIKIKGNAKAEIELTTGKIEGTAGYVQKVGDKYLYFTGGAELKGGTKISKSLLKSPWGIFYAKGSLGGFQCKNITSYVDNIPTNVK